MLTVTIIAQKGGAGKTTLALNLAVAAYLAQKDAAIIDLDPQGSALKWSRSRTALTELVEPGVISAHAVALPDILKSAQELDFVFIDTAPHASSDALVAAKAADIILIPFKPSIMDLHAIGTSFELAAIAKKPVFAVLNMAPSSGSMGKEAQEYLQDNDLPLCPFHLGNRAAFMRSVTDGKSVLEYEPEGKAASEISDLYTWLISQF